MVIELVFKYTTSDDSVFKLTLTTSVGLLHLTKWKGISLIGIQFFSQYVGSLGGWILYLFISFPALISENSILPSPVVVVSRLTPHRYSLLSHLTNLPSSNPTNSHNGSASNLVVSTFSIDFYNGGAVELFLTGDSTCSLTNVRPGSRYIIKVTTTGAQTLTPSASGYSFIYEGGGFSLTNNGTDICILDVWPNGIISISHFADFS